MQYVHTYDRGDQGIYVTERTELDGRVIHEHVRLIRPDDHDYDAAEFAMRCAP